MSDNLFGTFVGGPRSPGPSDPPASPGPGAPETCPDCPHPTHLHGDDGCLGQKPEGDTGPWVFVCGCVRTNGYRATSRPGAPEGTTDLTADTVENHLRWLANMAEEAAFAEAAKEDERAKHYREERVPLHQRRIREHFAALTSEVARTAEALAAVQANERTYWDRALAAEAEVARLTEENSAAKCVNCGKGPAEHFYERAHCHSEYELSGTTDPRFLDEYRASRAGSHTETETTNG